MKPGPVVRDLLRQIAEVWFLNHGQLYQSHILPQSTFTQLPPRIWGRPNPGLISTLDFFWKHPTLSRQNHNILCFTLLRLPFCKKNNSWVQKDGNEEQQQGNPSTAPGSGTPLWNLHALEGKVSAWLWRARKTIFLKINRSQEISGLEKLLWDTNRAWI